MGGVGRLLKRDWIAVEVVTDAGLVGIGESHHGQAPAAIANIVQHVLGPQLIGKPPHPAELWRYISSSYLRTHSPGAAAYLAYSGIDIALWDIAGQAAGQPICALWGYEPKPIKAYVGGHNLTYQPLDSLLDEAAHWAKEGFTGMKVRLGQGVEPDAKTVTALKDRLPPSVTLMADVNARYRLSDTLALLDRIDAQALGWLEEPLPPENLASYRRLRQATAQTLAGGENSHRLAEIDELATVFDVLQPDVTKVGGMTPLLDMIAVARLRGATVVPHAMHSIVSQAATMHVLAAIADTWLEHDPTVDRSLWETESGSLTVEQGIARLDPRPGLGVRPQFAGLDAYPGTPSPSYGPVSQV